MIVESNGEVVIDWLDVDPDLQEYTNLVVDDNTLAETPLYHNNFDAVVGIHRGGLIPAVIISHMLGLPLFTAKYSSRQNNIVASIDDNLDSKTHKNILLVDDIADSGQTLVMLTQKLTEVGHNVKTAVLVFKPESIHVPDYARFILPEGSGWVFFPWEEDQSFSSC